MNSGKYPETDTCLLLIPFKFTKKGCSFI